MEFGIFFGNAYFFCNLKYCNIKALIFLVLFFANDTLFLMHQFIFFTISAITSMPVLITENCTFFLPGLNYAVDKVQLVKGHTVRDFCAREVKVTQKLKSGEVIL